MIRMMNNNNNKKYISRQQSKLGRRRSNIPSLVCAFMASSTTGGTIYAFGIFANDLKHDLGISQIQLGIISSAFFIAGLFSWIPGIVVDKMKMKFSMSLGGISGAFFTTLYWILCRSSSGGGGHQHSSQQFFSFFHQYPVPILSILAIAICMSCGLIVGSVFKLTMLCGGPQGKGPAVGIAKGFVGLGSGIYATIFQAFRKSSESSLDFLPVIAFFFLLCATIPALLFLPNKNQSHPHLLNIETTTLHFRVMYITLFVLCCFIIASAIYDILCNTNDVIDVPTKDREYGKVMLILMIWLIPIVSLLYLPREKLEIHDDDGLPASEATHLFSQTAAATDDKSETAALSSGTPSDEDVDDDEEECRNSNKDDSQNAIMQSWRMLHEEEQNHGVLPKYQSLDPRKALLLASIAKISPSSQSLNVQENEEKEQMIHNTNIVVDFRADLSLPEMLQTSSSWIMLWITMILVGSGTTKTNNMGQMVESLGFDDTIVTPATLAIFSVAQATSRIVTGIVSEIALQHNFSNHGLMKVVSWFSGGDSPHESHQNQGGKGRGIPRPFFLAIASFVALIAHLLLALSTSLLSFVIGCAISAIAFGMAWPLMVSEEILSVTFRMSL